MNRVPVKCVFIAACIACTPCGGAAQRHPAIQPDSAAAKNMYISPWVAPFTQPGSDVPFALFGDVSIEGRFPMDSMEFAGISAGIGYMANSDYQPLRGMTVVLQGVVMRRFSREGGTALYFGLTYVKPWGNVLTITGGTDVDSRNPLNCIDFSLGADIALQQDMTFDVCVRIPLAHPLVPDGSDVIFGLALHIAIGEWQRAAHRHIAATLWLRRPVAVRIPRWRSTVAGRCMSRRCNLSCRCNLDGSD